MQKNVRLLLPSTAKKLLLHCLNAIKEQTYKPHTAIRSSPNSLLMSCFSAYRQETSYVLYVLFFN